MNQLESTLKQLRLHGMGTCWQALTETRKHHELSLVEEIGRAHV